MQKWAYMIVSEKGEPVILNYQLPIYWIKKLAVRDANQFVDGTKVVRIPMPRLETPNVRYD